MKIEKLAQKIAGYILRIQHGFACRMEKICSRIAVKNIKILVLVFSVLTGGLSLYFILEALWSPQNKLTIKPDSIYVPLQPRSSLFVNEETWNSIKEFKNYMDSLGVYAPRKYHSIMQKRPGLMDSINTFEQMYYSTK